MCLTASVCRIDKSASPSVRPQHINAKKVGKDHMEMDGVGMMIIPMRVFTLKKHPCKVEGKDLVK